MGSSKFLFATGNHFTHGHKDSSRKLHGSTSHHWKKRMPLDRGMNEEALTNLWWCTDRRSHSKEWFEWLQQRSQSCHRILPCSNGRPNLTNTVLGRIPGQTGNETWWILLHQSLIPWTVEEGLQQLPSRWKTSKGLQTAKTRGWKSVLAVLPVLVKIQYERYHDCYHKLPGTWNTSSTGLRTRRQGTQPVGDREERERGRRENGESQKIVSTNQPCEKIPTLTFMNELYRDTKLEKRSK